MKIIYERTPLEPGIPRLVIQDGDRAFYKITLRDRVLVVNHGTGVLDRGGGELDVPFVGAGRRPIGDFVYDSRDEARAAFARFRTDPTTALRLVLAGRKP